MNFMLETMLRVSAILLLALAGARLARSQPATLRHWVLAVGVACAWTSPLFSRAIPPWIKPPAWKAAIVSDTQLLEEHASTSAANSITVPSASDSANVSRAQATARALLMIRAGEVAQSLWLAGSFVCGVMLVVGMRRLRRLAAGARVIDSGPWSDVAEAMRKSYRRRFSLTLLQSDEPSRLITWGWRSPKIVLPAAAQDWPEDRIRIVLAHELAHIARGDWMVQLAAEALRAVFWFNPLLWITCSRLRMESEYACDDAVLARGIEGSEYATHLLALARSLNPVRRSWLMAPAMARPSSLEGRVQAMLNTLINRRHVSLVARAGTAAVLLMLTLAVAGIKAQSTFYSFTGTVWDPSNRVLPRTTLVLTNANTEAKHEVKTDATGRFEFVGLPSAQYRLSVDQLGFEPLKETLTIAGNLQRDLRMRVGTLQETITVLSGSATVPPTPPDPEALRRRLDAQRRFIESSQKNREKCVADGPSPVGGNIIPPAKLADAKPVYPENLRLANIGGVVTMEALIGTDGTVREVRDVKGPHPDLESAAALAVRQWRFSTTLLNCEPIDVEMKVTVMFAAGQ